jgi:hypothetical protein
MMMDSSFIYTELQPWLPLQEAVGGIPYDKALPALGFSENPTPPTDHLDCLNFTFQNLFTDIAECDGGNCHSRLCIGGQYPHLHYQDLNDLYESFFLVEPLISLLITIAPTLFKYVDQGIFHFLARVLCAFWGCVLPSARQLCTHEHPLSAWS